MQPVLFYGVPQGSSFGSIVALEWLGQPYRKKDDGKDYWSVDPMVKSILLCHTGKDAALS